MKLTIPISLALLAGNLISLRAEPVHGWLNWRGPQQNGTSLETGLPDTMNPDQPLWVKDFPGQSTAVVANGHVYIMGYLGEGENLQEGVIAYDADTGKELWRQLFNDFLSDTIYLRYGTSAPAVDPETGNVFIQGTQGIIASFTPDGKMLWQHSMMEESGRLTFPNSRTATPVIDKDLVITRGITANWGANGPGADRFYAYDKSTGQLVWTSTPGAQPKDNSFSQPYLGWLDGKRVLYSATGDGGVICVNVLTGDPIWRIPITKAGINSAVLVHHDDKVISIYGTPYEPGQLIALRIQHVTPTNAASAPIVVDRTNAQIWADDISTSTSSPILVGDRVYVVSEKGDLYCVNANDGTIFWKIKLGIEERNSCPIFADGKIYVPMLDDPDAKSEGSGESGTKGVLYVIRPSDKEGQIIGHVTLDGRCFGTPTAYNGKVYIQTTKHLYCFGKAGNNPGLAAEPAPEAWPAPGPAAQLQIIPSEVLMRPGQTEPFRVRELDAKGFLVRELTDSSSVKWASFIPPTAKVKSTMKGTFNAEGKLVATDEQTPSAGAFMATEGNLRGVIRGRILPYLPISQNFEWAQLTETNLDGSMYAYPPLPWIGARFKFDIEDFDGSKTLVKTTDNPFFQRATVFIGDPDTKNYTIEADVRTDGNKRVMSEVGLVNQRYYIVLKGGQKKLEIFSTAALFRHGMDFDMLANTWYHLKTRVDVNPDGSGVVRAKVWKKAEAEPDAWTFEVPHQHVNQNGAPGLFSFAPQKRTYIDNITVTPNK